MKTSTTRPGTSGRWARSPALNSSAPPPSPAAARGTRRRRRRRGMRRRRWGGSRSGGWRPGRRRRTRRRRRRRRRRTVRGRRSGRAADAWEPRPASPGSEAEVASSMRAEGGVGAEEVGGVVGAEAEEVEAGQAGAEAAVGAAGEAAAGEAEAVAEEAAEGLSPLSTVQLRCMGCMTHDIIQRVVRRLLLPLTPPPSRVGLWGERPSPRRRVAAAEGGGTVAGRCGWVKRGGGWGR